ncbi:MAG: hypothetical protein U1F68_02070 [Gammaproteobacteria bacterium]
MTMNANMNVTHGGQAAAILYQFLGEAGLIADSPEILTHRDEILPQALEMLAAFHANPQLNLAAHPHPVKHYAVLLINLVLVDLMQQAEAYSARLPRHLSIREQAALLIGRELERDNRQSLMKSKSA